MTAVAPGRSAVGVTLTRKPPARAGMWRSGRDAAQMAVADVTGLEARGVGDWRGAATPAGGLLGTATGAAVGDAMAGGSGCVVGDADTMATAVLVAMAGTAVGPVGVDGGAVTVGDTVGVGDATKGVGDGVGRPAVGGGVDVTI